MYVQLWASLKAKTMPWMFLVWGIWILKNFEPILLGSLVWEVLMKLKGSAVVSRVPRSTNWSLEAAISLALTASLDFSVSQYFTCTTFEHPCEFALVFLQSFCANLKLTKRERLKSAPTYKKTQKAQSLKCAQRSFNQILINFGDQKIR